MKSLVSVIIVNFRSARYLRECLRSIGGQHTDVEVVIVDNNSGGNEREMLESLRPDFPFLSVTYNGDNKGFSKANNQAITKSNGDYILFLNPDTFLFPSCLERLISFLETTVNAGGITARLWMDREKNFLLPPSYLPSPWGKLRDRIVMSRGSFFSAYQRRWLRKAITYWSTRAPLPVEAISGAFFMTTKRVLETVGKFDERFPLYFEDSDLCRRIKKAGLTLYQHHAAEAVHFYNQSAKSSGESTHKFLASEKLYMEKHHGGQLLRFVNSLKIPAKNAGIASSSMPWDFSRPINVANGYILLSPFSTFIPCAAHKAKEEDFFFGRDLVGNLAPGLYHVATASPCGIIKKQFVIEKR